MGDGREPVGDPDHVGPRIAPRWFDVVRQVVIFVLGVWLIVFAATTTGHDLPFIVTGLVLLGMIPMERAMRRRD